MAGMRRFHKENPSLALQVNVSRYPYSFIGDDHGGGRSLAGADDGLKESWHDALLGYMGNDPRRRDQAEHQMQGLAASAGIKFDYSVLAQWQPVESQRCLLWAGRFGLQEPFMSALNKRHFEQNQSASLRSTILAAAEEVGLDAKAAAAFLETTELEDVVWSWYGRTIKEKKIHSIPFFAFSAPAIGAIGGPFRTNGAAEPYVVRGSMNADYFFTLFSTISADVSRGGRAHDAAAALYYEHEIGTGTCRSK